MIEPFDPLQHTDQRRHIFKSRPMSPAFMAQSASMIVAKSQSQRSRFFSLGEDNFEAFSNALGLKNQS
jgi:hypothetical protein